MRKFEWKSEYEIGSELIDTQHKQLLEFANGLLEAVSIADDKSVVKGAFDILLDYTKTHFHDEEMYFTEIATPLLEEHKVEHVELAKEVDDLWQDDILGFRDNSINLIQQWVENRLIPHMQISDKKAMEQAK